MDAGDDAGTATTPPAHGSERRLSRVFSPRRSTSKRGSGSSPAGARDKDKDKDNDRDKDGDSVVSSAAASVLSKLRDRHSVSSSRADADALTPSSSRRSSEDSAGSGTTTGNRLSRLMSSASRRHRSRKARRESRDAASTGTGSSLRHATSMPTAPAGGPGTADGDLHRDSLDSLTQSRSIASSLLTEDSDPEQSTRPHLRTRPSHADYLTLSSPLVAAETVEPEPEPEPEAAATQPSADPATAPARDLDTPPEQAPADSNPPSPLSRPASKEPKPARPRAVTLDSSPVPTTRVTPPTPVSPQAAFKRKPVGISLGPLPASPRRSRPNNTSPRLQLAALPALTPAIEEVKTPGGSLIQPTQNSGFFASVVSATQTAGSQITSFFSLPTNNNTRSRSSTQSETGPAGGEEVILSPSSAGAHAAKEPAVKTLGSGDLRLSHLGIHEADMDERDDAIVQPSTAASRAEEAAAAEAVAAAYKEHDKTSDRLSPEKASPEKDRPSSIASGSIQESPPQSLLNGADSHPKRNNSVRSRLSERHKRHRNSSVTTGGALAAALNASHATLANPVAAGKTPRFTGFAVANQKRNKDFHGLFKSVPDEDFLIEDYSAALQREILLHGRLYVSEKNICFSSNIMGYVTTLVVSFSEVVAMEKRNTAMIFPNAIMIQTLHAKNTFASFMNRENTYELLLGIWKMKHPNLKETETGHALDTSSPEKAQSDSSEGESDDSDDDSDGSVSQLDAASIISNPESARTTKTTPPAEGNGTGGGAPADPPTDAPGPATHAPTEADADIHYEKLVLDDSVPAPLGKVYSMMFGPQSGVCMRKFLEEQESGDIQYDDDKKGMGEAAKSFSYSYIKKLTASLGPKQTKCNVSQTLDTFDLEKAVVVTCSTATPDVPNGNVFVTKTRYVLMWGPSNSTKVQMSSTVEWSGKSWIKGPIEKGAEQGQAQHGKDLVTFLKGQLSSSSPGKSKGGKRKRKKSEAADPAKKPKSVAAQAPDWGFLQPLQPVLAPVADVLGPLASVNVVLGVLLAVVSLLWLRQAWAGGGRPNRAGAFDLPSQRLAAYEELWQREESELWSWMEARLAVHDVGQAATGGGAGAGIGSPSKPAAPLSSPDAAAAAAMRKRQVADAIRVTEEKLAALKASVERG